MFCPTDVIFVGADSVRICCAPAVRPSGDGSCKWHTGPARRSEDTRSLGIPANREGSNGRIQSKEQCQKPRRPRRTESRPTTARRTSASLRHRNLVEARATAMGCNVARSAARCFRFCVFAFSSSSLCHPDLTILCPLHLEARRCPSSSNRLFHRVDSTPQICYDPTFKACG